MSDPGWLAHSTDPIPGLPGRCTERLLADSPPRRIPGPAGLGSGGSGKASRVTRSALFWWRRKLPSSPCLIQSLANEFAVCRWAVLVLDRTMLSSTKALRTPHYFVFIEPENARDANRFDRLGQRTSGSANQSRSPPGPAIAVCGETRGIANGRVVVVADTWREVVDRLRQVEPDPAKCRCIEASADYDRVEEIWRVV